MTVDPKIIGGNNVTGLSKPQPKPQSPPLKETQEEKSFTETIKNKFPAPSVSFDKDGTMYFSNNNEIYPGQIKVVYKNPNEIITEKLNRTITAQQTTDPVTAYKQIASTGRIGSTISFEA